MQGFGPKTKLEKTATTISGLEFKQLLIQLLNTQTICIRFRLIGEMWMPHFVRVHAVNEKVALFYEEKKDRYSLAKFNNIMQFELDERFQIFQPNYHYDVIPSPELE
ncbi:MAG TPA: hypothetical protein VEB86_03835 [Chryseosolibacter sp.]|nr:hypothetical protein [Chryseosolibacter sp.]